MRDAQSLLEQLLSSGGERLTADRVHQLLGIAGDDRVLDLLDALADRDPGRTLTILDQAVNDGVQPTELTKQNLQARLPGLRGSLPAPSIPSGSSRIRHGRQDYPGG